MKYIHSSASLLSFTCAIILTMVTIFLSGCMNYEGDIVLEKTDQVVTGTSDKEEMNEAKTESEEKVFESTVKLRTFSSYNEIVETEIDSIVDGKYRESFYKNRSLEALKAIDFLNELGYADTVLKKKIDNNSIIGIFNILKDSDNQFAEDYLKESLLQTGNTASLIVSSNYYDFDTGLSAYISDKYNIPYFIISYKDGEYRGGGTGFKSNLDELDKMWKKEGLYMEVAPFIGELNFARKYGGYENIVFDKTKKEVLEYLEMLLEDYDTVYYFSNIHGQSVHNNRLLLYSSHGLEYLVPQDISSVLSKFEETKRFIFIGHHCYSNFEKDLSVLLEDLGDIEYLLLSASSGKSVETNMLQAINYASDGILTIKELEDISEGLGSFASEIFQHELGERKICYFLTDIPGYIMELECEGVGDLDIMMRTNFKHSSIFYYQPDIFNPEHPY